MMNLQGSWVAMPTPFTEDNQVDIEGFKLLIARQIKYGTNQLFILGSAGEVTLLSIEEKMLSFAVLIFADLPLSFQHSARFAR